MDVGQQPTEPDRTTFGTTPVAEPPQNPLFFGPGGLRPFWCLLVYALILTIPIAILVALAHIQHAGATAAGEKQLELTPFTSAIAEWLQLAIVFFATWVMSRIEDRDVFDYGLARSNRRIHWLITGTFWGVFWLSVLIGILVLTGHLVITSVLLGPLQAIRYAFEWGVMFIGVGFFEEFFFRGYLQFTLARCLAGAVKMDGTLQSLRAPHWLLGRGGPHLLWLWDQSWFQSRRVADRHTLRRSRGSHVHVQSVAHGLAVVGHRHAYRLGLGAVLPIWRRR